MGLLGGFLAAEAGLVALEGAVGLDGHLAVLEHVVLAQLPVCDCVFVLCAGVRVCVVDTT